MTEAHAPLDFFGVAWRLGATIFFVLPMWALRRAEPVALRTSGPLRAFTFLQRERQHRAVVVDEHGTAIGLAFREDALEEIVGPLGDEFDEDERAFRELSGGLPAPTEEEAAVLAQAELVT